MDGDTTPGALAGLFDPALGRLSPRVYCDPDLYRLEQERVFGRCWLFITHESMIPRAGDFFATFAGEDPVLAVRQPDGSVRVILNQCRHRSARLCRADRGNTRAFTCSYHGWTYDLGGNLVSVPREATVFPNGLDKAAWGAVRAPHVKNWFGLIFATWDPDAPSFEDYLGDAAWYMEALLARSAAGTEVIGGVQKWQIEANWKLAAEQFTSDVYHFETTHVGSTIALLPENMPPEAMAQAPETTGRQFRSAGGHGVAITRDVALADMQVALTHGPAIAAYYATRREEATRLLGTTRGAGSVGVHANLFPTLAYLPAIQTLRVWHPKGPDKMEVWAWTLVDRDAPQEIKDAMRRRTQFTFGSSGIFEQDDAENWAEVQRVMRGTQARKTVLNIQMGRGESADPDGVFPGTTDSIISEHAARSFYARWAELMSLPVKRRAEAPVHAA